MFDKAWIKKNIHLNNADILTHFGYSPYSTTSLYNFMRKNNIKRTKKQIKHLVLNGLKTGRELAKFAPRKKVNQKGELNNNWKGGISKDNYRYKKIQANRYPERIKARNAVSSAIKSGRLLRQPCYVCGNKKSFAHHEDYNNHLDVDWYCREHHRDIHDGKH